MHVVLSLRGTRTELGRFRPFDVPVLFPALPSSLFVPWACPTLPLVAPQSSMGPFPITRLSAPSLWPDISRDSQGVVAIAKRYDLRTLSPSLLRRPTSQAAPG